LFGKIAKILNSEFVFKKNGVSRDKCEEDELLEEIKEGKRNQIEREPNLGKKGD